MHQARAAAADRTRHVRNQSSGNLLWAYDTLLIRARKADVDAGVYGFTAATQEVFGRFGTGAWNLLKKAVGRLS